VVTWDVLSSSGVPVASGVYFIRLALGEQTLSEKLVVLR